MTDYITKLFLRPALITCFGLLPAGQVTAQTYFVLHRFNGYNDGATPFELLLSSNVLYGTAGNTGHFNWGTVFKIDTDGTGFTNLYNFTGGSDGGGPTCGVIKQHSVWNNVLSWRFMGYSIRTEHRRHGFCEFV